MHILGIVDKLVKLDSDYTFYSPLYGDMVYDGQTNDGLLRFYSKKHEVFEAFSQEGKVKINKIWSQEQMILPDSQKTWQEYIYLLDQNRVGNIQFRKYFDREDLYEFVVWKKDARGKDYCFVVANYVMDRDGTWSIHHVGSRVFELNNTDKKSYYQVEQMAYNLLAKQYEDQ